MGETKTILISGFLGSGKTELVREIISQNKGKKIYVIENEVAEFGVDGKISYGENVKVVEINDGSIAGVNLNNLGKVVRSCIKENPDIMIIEASGAAKTEPVLAMLNKLKLECNAVAVIDAERFSKAEKLSTYTLGHIANASIVLLNKADIVEKDTLKKQMDNLMHLNKNVVCCIRCKVDTKEIFESRIAKATGIKSKKENYLLWKIKNNLGIISKKEKHQNINSYVYESYGIVDEERLKTFLSKSRLPRAKGFITSDDDKLYYFSFVNGHFTKEEAPKQERTINRMVLIGENVFYKRSMLKKRLDRCVSKNIGQSFNNVLHFLKNQQKVNDRVVYI